MLIAFIRNDTFFTDTGKSICLFRHISSFYAKQNFPTLLLGIRSLPVTNLIGNIEEDYVADNDSLSRVIGTKYFFLGISFCIC